MAALPVLSRSERHQQGSAEDPQADLSRAQGRVERCGRRQGTGRPERSGRKLQGQAPRLGRVAREQHPGGLHRLTLPDRHRVSVRTSNPMERAIQQELKRRTRIVMVFPNERSLLRLCSAVLIQRREVGVREDLHHMGEQRWLIKAEQLLLHTSRCIISASRFQH